MREAAHIGQLAPGSDDRIALVAAPNLNYARERRGVFVINRRSGDVQRFNLGGDSADSVAWLNEQELLVVVSDPSTGAIPRHRELRRLILADGSLEKFP